jgi:hypothetical protein
MKFEWTMGPTDVKQCRPLFRITGEWLGPLNDLKQWYASSYSFMFEITQAEVISEVGPTTYFHDIFLCGRW